MDLGARQGTKYASPDMQKDIDILMASLSRLEVYIEKEGRTLDPDEMPVPDAVSVGLTDLAHGSALADYNSQFERNRECHCLVPISTLLQHNLDNPTPSHLQPPPATRTWPPDSLNTIHALLPALP
jgi:hypothetical protein